jgi:hypothetical protein
MREMITPCLFFYRGPDANIFKAWNLKCDSQEIYDLLAFQDLTAKLPIKDLPSPTAYTEKLHIPEFTAVPLSTIFVMHHNLVTYGVPCKYTVPGPEHRFYSPEQAVKMYAGSPLFKEDTVVQNWLSKTDFDPAIVKGAPGAKDWVKLVTPKVSCQSQFAKLFPEGNVDDLSKVAVP